MSVDYLRFIPTDPEYDPPLAEDQQVKLLLASFTPKSAEITIDRYDMIQFVDAGSNWEPIYCPGCGAILEDEAWEIWSIRRVRRSLPTFLPQCRVAERSLPSTTCVMDGQWVLLSLFSKFVTLMQI